MDLVKKLYPSRRTYDPIDRAEDEDPLVAQDQKRPSETLQRESSPNYWKAFFVAYLLLTILGAALWLVTRKADCTCKPFPSYNTEFGRSNLRKATYVLTTLDSPSKDGYFVGEDPLLWIYTLRRRWCCIQSYRWPHEVYRSAKPRGRCCLGGTHGW